MVVPRGVSLNVTCAARIAGWDACRAMLGKRLTRKN
jgi:hypothetical protein